MTFKYNAKVGKPSDVYKKGSFLFEKQHYSIFSFVDLGYDSKLFELSFFHFQFAFDIT